MQNKLKNKTENVNRTKKDSTIEMINHLYILKVEIIENPYALFKTDYGKTFVMIEENSFFSSKMCETNSQLFHM